MGFRRMAFVIGIAALTVSFAVPSIAPSILPLPHASPLSAQDNPTEQESSIAERAAVILKFNDGTVGNQQPTIFTIHWEGGRCDIPLGGTVHRITGSTTTTALGHLNKDSEIIFTHNNFDLRSQSSNNAEQCRHVLVVTSSLNCSFTLKNSMDDELMRVEKGTDVNTPSQGRTVFRGKSFASENENFFLPSVNMDLTGNAQGALEADTSAAGESYVDILAVDAALPVATLTLTATDCDVPQALRGFSLTNAEPPGSLELSINLEVQNPTCIPVSGQNTGEIAVGAGISEKPQLVELDTTCPLFATIGHASTQTLNAETNQLKSQCGVNAVLYVVDESGTFPAGSTAVTYIIVTDTEAAVDVLEFGFSSSTGYMEYKNQIISRITLFLSTDCPDFSQLRLGYVVTPDTASVVRKTSVQASIVRAPGSSASCIATPAVVSIPAASGTDSLTEGNPLLEGEDSSVGIIIVTRPRTGRTCNYMINYSRVEGPLSLIAEYGYIPGTREESGEDPGTTPEAEFMGSGDGSFDASIIRNALALRNRTIYFTYEIRRVPITLTMTFPDDIVFATQDQASYRISLAGPCARYTPILTRAFGSTGAFRLVQAYPGTTAVFDATLRNIESTSSQAGSFLYDIEPVIILGEDTSPRAVPCSVEAEELITPAGCSLIGNKLQQLTFTEGLVRFAFNFRHICSGLPINTSGRGITG